MKKHFRSFLIWPGGKYRLIDQIKIAIASLPYNGKRFVDPFVGSGILFLNTSYKSYLLCDINADLINVYKSLQEYKHEFIKYSKSFFIPENNTKDRYYYLRDMFNASSDVIERSALFLYLNRHGYNGLIRYNAEGKFNVPFGRHSHPYFPEKEMLFFISKCERAEVTFKVQDFRETFQEVAIGDVVYCDPPYVPLSDTSNFTRYSKENFNLKDQQDLLLCARTSSAKGIPVIISNHKTQFVLENYNTKMITVQVRRNISCKERNKVEEVIAVFYG